MKPVALSLASPTSFTRETLFVAWFTAGCATGSSLSAIDDARPVVNIKLPPVIQKYVDSSNRHDVDSILSCFSDDAVVCDEGGEFRGRETVGRWILKTIEKYKFQLTPLSVKGEK